MIWSYQLSGNNNCSNEIGARKPKLFFIIIIIAGCIHHNFFQFFSPPSPNNNNNNVICASDRSANNKINEWEKKLYLWIGQRILTIIIIEIWLQFVCFVHYYREKKFRVIYLYLGYYFLSPLLRYNRIVKKLAIPKKTIMFNFACGQSSSFRSFFLILGIDSSRI